MLEFLQGTVAMRYNAPTLQHETLTTLTTHRRGASSGARAGRSAAYAEFKAQRDDALQRT